MSAFRHRNFRLYFLGQGLSALGTWIQVVAQSWLVFRLTASPFQLGLTAFASQIPFLVVTPFAGIWCDRLNRHRLLLITQTLAMTQALVLGVLTLTHVITAWHVVALAFVLGIINAFDLPVRQSLLPLLLDDRKDLPQAVALHGTVVHAARFLGPSIAGIMIAHFSEGTCFILNGLSYVAIIVAALSMRLSAPPPKATEVSVLQGLATGLRYAFDSPPIRAMLAMVAVVSFTITPCSALMPLFASKTFHGDAHTLGLLLGAIGFGSLLGTFYLASRKSTLGLERAATVAGIIAGGALIAFSRSNVLWFCLGTMALVGVGALIQATVVNTILQTTVEDDKRGRVMSLYSMAFFGVSPLGSLVAGRLATTIGASNVLFLGGGCCALAALAFARPIWRVRALLKSGYERRNAA